MIEVSTKQERIAELAKRKPWISFTSLNHHLNLEWLKEAYKRVKKYGSSGVDGVSAGEYGENLEENLADLLERAKSGTYYAPPVKRGYIPKGIKGDRRPIGIPTTEDKVLQKAVTMLLEPIYEQDFRDCSMGYRPNRSPHQALEKIRRSLMEMGGGWVFDVDVKGYFDNIDHGCLRDLLRQRVRDGVLVKLIGKWLHAGVMEEYRVWYPESGTPQGAVISPLLSNIYLHYVLDEWFEEVVKRHLKGRAELVRFADDFVIFCQYRHDAERVQEVLVKRFEKYSLQLHPEKTRMVRFISPRGGGGKPETFNFLGFTHYWEKSRKGNWVVRQKTAKDRLTRSLGKVWQWCRKHRHDPVEKQCKGLCRKLLGHYGYYGITGNWKQIKRFYWFVKRAWRYWLNRRRRENDMPWRRFLKLLERYPLTQPRIVHSIYAAKP